MASHFELDLMRFAIAFDARRCLSIFFLFVSQTQKLRCVVKQESREQVLLGMRRVCLARGRNGRRERERDGGGPTRGIFSLADFDELLDVGHFFRHDGRELVTRAKRWETQEFLRTFYDFSGLKFEVLWELARYNLVVAALT